VTIIQPDGVVKGISADYPFVKVFEPSTLTDQTAGTAKRSG